MARAAHSVDPSEYPPIVGLAWDDFLLWLQGVWEQGQHMTLVGATGRGKSTFATQVLQLRSYVVAFDAKGGDRTLAAAVRRGMYEKVGDWPVKNEQRRIEKGEPIRVVLSPPRQSADDLPRVREVYRRVLSDVFERGGWAVYADELTIMASRKMMALEKELTTLLIAARDKGVSVVTLMQQGEGTDFKTALRQYSVLVVWPTRNREVIASLAEIAGLPRDLMETILRRLPKHSVLVVHTGWDEIIITQAPMLA